MAKIDLNRVWDDAKAMGVANKDLLAAISGMFVLLPNVIAPQFIKTVEKVPAGLSQEKLLQFQLDRYLDNWPVLIATSLVTSFGALAMLVLLLRTERLTVAESLKAAIILLPGYFVASIAQSFGAAVGLMLFVLPGVYLLARLSLIGAVAAAEHRFNPVELLSRSVSLTKGNGWRIVLLFAIFIATTGIVWLVVNSIVGAAAEMLLAKDIALLVTSIVSGLISAGFEILSALLIAAIYRAATSSSPTPWLPGAGG